MSVERLTERHYKAEEGYYLRCSANVKCIADCEHCDKLDEAINRLGAYEDTCMDPDLIARGQRILELFADATKGIPLNRLRELAQADRDGRVVVLPCKVGDTVYGVATGEIRRYKIISMSFLISEHTRHLALHGQNCRGATVPLEQAYFGKTVFLTREEAEKTLGGGEDD